MHNMGLLHFMTSVGVWVTLPESSIRPVPPGGVQASSPKFQALGVRMGLERV